MNKKIELNMGGGRLITGTLENETDNYYQITVSSVDGGIGKGDWKKGDLVKISKQLVKSKANR